MSFACEGQLRSGRRMRRMRQSSSTKGDGHTGAGYSRRPATYMIEYASGRRESPASRLARVLAAPRTSLSCQRFCASRPMRGFCESVPAALRHSLSSDREIWRFREFDLSSRASEATRDLGRRCRPLAATDIPRCTRNASGGAARMAGRRGMTGRGESEVTARRREDDSTIPREARSEPTARRRRILCRATSRATRPKGRHLKTLLFFLTGDCPRASIRPKFGLGARGGRETRGMGPRFRAGRESKPYRLWRRADPGLTPHGQPDTASRSPRASFGLRERTLMFVLRWRLLRPSASQ